MVDRDRTVHGISADGYEIVRYDRAGKWYLEDGPTKRVRALRIADAAALATEGQAHLGKPGGQAFDKRVRDLQSPKPMVCDDEPNCCGAGEVVCSPTCSAPKWTALEQEADRTIGGSDD